MLISKIYHLRNSHIELKYHQQTAGVARNNISLFYHNLHYDLLVPIAPVQESYFQKNDPQKEEIFLHDNYNIPVFYKSSKSPSILEVFKLLKDARNLQKSSICSQVPYSVDFSSTFIVDLEKLRDVSDIKENNTEALEHHSQPLR